MAELAKQDSVAARALQFTILTAARRGEVLGARWDEMKAGLWTIPGQRMKGGVEHRVPLPRQAVALLDGLPKVQEHVFPGPLSTMAMIGVLKSMGYSRQITVHGFRSSFRDWASERTNHPSHVVEMALAHAIGDKVEAAYRRSDLLDRRRALMQEWASYCCSAQRKRSVQKRR
jgi:integrase